ncbi:hypothetical protein ACJX0J_020958, partial [Zea mays]
MSLFGLQIGRATGGHKATRKTLNLLGRFGHVFVVASVAEYKHVKKLIYEPCYFSTQIYLGLKGFVFEMSIYLHASVTHITAS